MSVGLASAVRAARLRKASVETFTFGVPLIARASSVDWSRVNDLLELTLRSVLAQTDGRFRLLLAAHDEPDCWRQLTRDDPRFRFVRARWPPERPSAANDDGGCKKWLVKQMVRRSGGGLLMYLDADDLIDTRLVETARALINRSDVGAIVEHGVAIDFSRLRALRLPDRQVFDGEFHRLCGSSTIARVEPDSPDPLRRDPYDLLGSHHRWLEAAHEANVSLVRLPVWGGYLVNTAENHSELHGPFADWRRRFNAGVAAQGAPLDRDLASRFGLTLEEMRSKSRARPH